MLNNTLGLVRKLLVAKAILVVLNELVTFILNVHELLHVVFNYLNREFIDHNGNVEA